MDDNAEPRVKSHTALEMEKLLSLPVGRSFLRRLLFTYTNVFHNAHTLEPQATSYQLGQQAIGQLVLAEIFEADPSALALLMSEEKTDE